MKDKQPSEYTNIELVEEIKKQKELLGQMTGWLYSSILTDKIAVLDEERRRRIKELGGY